MIHLRGFRTNILIIIGSFIIALSCIEICYQLFFSEKFPKKRFHFITNPSLLDQYNSFGYNENTHIREVVVYAHNRQFYIEYDTSFITNNIGLVQKNPFDPKKKSLVIIGDSFTQGQGVTPWFYQLEDDWKDNEYQLINLGLIGTGIAQWKDALQWFSKMGEINKIVMCCISDDWTRPRWYICESSEQKALVFNQSRENNFKKNHKKPIIYFIGKDLDHHAILEKAKFISDYSDNDKVINNYFIPRIMHQVFFKYNSFFTGYDNLAFSHNKNSFDQIISAYGADNITVLHLPQKDEVMQGRYSELGTKIKDFIVSRHIPYIDGLALCKLNQEDFFRDDGHPNASGYKKIYECFARNVLGNVKFD